VKKIGRVKYKIITKSNSKLLIMAVAYNNVPYIDDDDNLETFALLWLDAEVNSSEENRHAQRQLRSTINYLKTFEDANLCRQYIQFVSSCDRLVLIVSGRLGQEIVPQIHHIRQLSSIYVYCMDKPRYEQWAKDFSKVLHFIFTLFSTLLFLFLCKDKSCYYRT